MRSSRIAIYGARRHVASPAGIWGADAYWFDPSDTAHQTIETGLKYWADRSGTYTIEQLTGANQPTRNATLLDSKPGFVFDGSNDFLRATGLTGLTGSLFSLLLIYRHTGAPAANRSWASLSDASQVTCGLVNSNTGGNECAVLRTTSAGPQTANSGTDGGTTWHIGVARLPASGYGHVLLDGVKTDSTVPGGVNIDGGTNTISLGVHATGSGVVGMECVDMVIVKRATTDAEINAFARWAASKYPSLPAQAQL